MAEPTERGTIVVIDDDPVMLLACRKILSKVGYRVATFDSGARALASVGELQPELVLVDLKMPGISGMEVISTVHELDPLVVIVVITGYATIATAVEALKAGAYDFLPKPFSPDELRLIVDRGLERRRLLLDSHRLQVERELLKRQFVTFVSHELQRPLVAIHQYLDVLKHLGDSPATAEKRREWLDRCLARTDEMLAIIKDWLTLSTVESGHFIEGRRKVDLKPILLDTVKTYEAVAATSRIALEIALPADEYLVNGDRNCLSVLFDNLIANALKYNKASGKVSVSAEISGGEISCSVTDTGIGIADEAIPRLFDEFFRAAASQASRPDGTGLGLTICKKIVTELGGNIEVESELGVGSTFRVRLPAYREPMVETDADGGSG